MNVPENNAMNRTLSEKISGILILLVIIVSICGCSGTNKTNQNDLQEDVTITLFAAKSLINPLDEIIKAYREENPHVIIQTNYDSSGTLMTQVSEGGAECDIFFSASVKQIDELEKRNLIIDGTRMDLLRNQLCVVTYKGSLTEVTGLTDLYKASSLAIASESVPVGDYTRRALINSGILNAKEDSSKITSNQISDVFGGVSINECANAGAVVTAVAEQSNEAGTVYYSDIYGHEDELQIIEVIPVELTGEIIYPLAQIVNADADDRELTEAKKFIDYLKSEESKAIYERYQFTAGP